MIQDSPIARFIGHGISAMTSIGDSPHDSEEDKLAHHHLIYMGLLMSCGGVVWGAIAVFYGLILAGGREPLRRCNGCRESPPRSAMGSARCCTSSGGSSRRGW